MEKVIAMKTKKEVLEIVSRLKEEIKENPQSKIREIFFHRGRLCMVLERGKTYPFNFHNGYVQNLPKNNNKSYTKLSSRIYTTELTFGGSFSFAPNIFFFGFDTGHYWNDEHPESKTFEGVKKTTIQLCDEMIKKKI